MNQLYFVFLHDILDRLNFHDKLVWDPQIRSKGAYNLPLVPNLKIFLLQDGNSQLVEFDAQRIFINSFDKAKAEYVMNLVGTSYDRMGEVVDFHQILREKKDFAFDRIGRTYKITSENQRIVPMQTGEI